MSSDIVAIIKNGHVSGCGEPPNLNSEDFDYLGYFTSNLGDQFILVREKRPDRLGPFKVYCGDAGWGKCFESKEGVSRITPSPGDTCPVFGGLILGEREAAILTLMMQAATAHDEFNREKQKEAKR